ncbi:NAD(P)H-dependent oxidoreductase [Solidesulfovibrio sp.]
MTARQQPVVFLCGPRAGGNSDTAGLAFADGLAKTGSNPRVLALRDHGVAPCRGCGACAGPGHRCPLDREGDAAAMLFAALDAAPLAAFAAPIYFYHVPALFKALIDRAQRRYEIRAAAVAGAALAGTPGTAATPGGHLPPDRPAYPLLVAGRPQGERLFEGALLTLKYFLWPFGFVLGRPCLLRGLDAPGDLAGNAEALAGLGEAGQAAGR